MIAGCSMKVTKKKLILGATITVLVVLVVLGVTKPKHVDVIQVEPKDTKISFTEEGFVKDENIIDVYSLHSGSVVSLLVKENQLIKAGEPICIIDSSKLVYDLETARNSNIGLQSQMNNLDLQEKQKKDELLVNKNKLKWDYSSLEAEEKNASQSFLSAEVTKDEQIRLQNIIIEQNKKDLQTAEENLQKTEILYNSGVISKSEVDKSQAEVNQIKSQLSQNNTQLEIIKNTSQTQSRQDYYNSSKNSLQAQINGLDNQLKNNYSQAMKTYYQAQMESGEASITLLEKQIDECIIKAPSDGMITKLNANKSNIIDTNTPVAVIATGFDNLIEVYVPTSEIKNVHLQDKVELTLKSTENMNYVGVVTEIDEKAVVKTSSLGVEKRKVKVTIKPIEQHVQYFKPGYDLSATFTKYYGENKLTVPRTAVFEVNDKICVWVIINGKIEQRDIEIEKELKVEYVVKTGVAMGEQVLKDATIPWLRTGKKVEGDL